jgi:hypothetical protein
VDLWRISLNAQFSAHQENRRKRGSDGNDARHEDSLFTSTTRRQVPESAPERDLILNFQRYTFFHHQFRHWYQTRSYR